MPPILMTEAAKPNLLADTVLNPLEISTILPESRMLCVLPERPFMGNTKPNLPSNRL